MRIKYFQALANIGNHYDDIKRLFGGSDYDILLLDTWDIKDSDYELIYEEGEVIKYLIGCQLGFVHDKDVLRPDVNVVNRLFNRHVSFLEKHHGFNELSVKAHFNPLTLKEYEACCHYILKFSLTDWYDKLPSIIQSFENKYSYLDDEDEIDIP